MIIASSIKLNFGSRSIFDGISFNISSDSRIGLIGKNGSGKSTLLESIVGLQELDSGSITISKNKKVAYLGQDVVLSSSLSILDETMTAFEEMIKIKAKLTKIEEKLANASEAEDLEEYSTLYEKLNQLNPDSAKTDAKKMLLGLGFKEQNFDQPVTSLSVGWRMRIVLAKLLLQKADFYLFDEPTNHLDIFAKDWFLEFLQHAPFGFLLVCHERYFLDKLCPQIFELELGKGTFYQGNYSAYEIQKEQSLEQLESAYQLQQKEIKQKQDTINRFRASASRAKQAQSMMKELDKIERIVLPQTTKNIKLSFPPITRAGRSVLNVDNVEHAFASNPIFKNISFEIERGQRVGLVASNGGGKSTLLNIICKKLNLQKGCINFGLNVSYSIFDQDQNAELDDTKSIIENIDNNRPANVNTATVRGLLGAFLFSGDDINKKVSVLSGGEKNRVGMVRVLLQQTNFLLLDEPTNHLDMDSKKILLEALRRYEGTILFVSHDRAFLNDLATRIIELTPTGIISFEGDYDQYLYYKQHMNTETTKHVGMQNNNIPTMKTGNKDYYELQKRSNALEKKIAQLEQKIKDGEEAFANLTYGSQEYKEAESNFNSLKSQLKETMAEWELILSKF